MLIFSFFSILKRVLPNDFIYIKRCHQLRGSRLDRFHSAFPLLILIVILGLDTSRLLLESLIKPPFSYGFPHFPRVFHRVKAIFSPPTTPSHGHPRPSTARALLRHQRHRGEACEATAEAPGVQNGHLARHQSWAVRGCHGIHGLT